MGFFDWIREKYDNFTIDENTKQAMSSIGSTLVEGAKILMATMLSVFVPQYCEDTMTTCTLEQNFKNLTLFNEFVLAFNFITLGIFINLTYIINKREIYFISHLDESREHAYNSLSKNMKLYPKYMRRIKEFNNSMFLWTKITMIFFIMNVIFSNILIFYFYYDGFRSITVTISNVLLVSNKLYQSFDICKTCLGVNPMALSLVKQTPVSYNVIDFNYSILKQRKRRTSSLVDISVKKSTPKRKSVGRTRTRSKLIP